MLSSLCKNYSEDIVQQITFKRCLSFYIVKPFFLKNISNLTALGIIMVELNGSSILNTIDKNAIVLLTMRGEYDATNKRKNL